MTILSHPETFFLQYGPFTFINNELPSFNTTNDTTMQMEKAFLSKNKHTENNSVGKYMPYFVDNLKIHKSLMFVSDIEQNQPPVK